MNTELQAYWTMLQKYRLYRKLIDHQSQVELIDDILGILDGAPLFVPAMPGTGKPFSVRMSNCGSLGWVSDRTGGYRYQDFHPETGEKWPPVPQRLLELWHRLTDIADPPEACLINAYSAKARMGLHQDRDEENLEAPVMSVSLGNTAVFRLGGLKRRDPTTSFRLETGDILLLAGTDRLAFHGIDRIEAGTSALLEQHFPGIARINLTLRKVHK